MKVLFVDDESRVLEGIERLLFQLDVDWETSFAADGKAALAELEKQRFDVIVSDMRMPGMDGATLLKHVSESFPHMVRIVLSGQTDESAAMRAVHVAHQFLVKPCTPEALQQVIERTRELAAWLDDDALKAAVGRVDRLPSAPRVFTELSAALATDSASAESVGKIVKQDPAMSSKLLQIANSSFFALRTTVSDVGQAVNRLGMNTIRSLALGIGAFESARERGTAAGVSVEEVQQRSLAIARLASKIGRASGDADAAFMAGLVCDVGELIMTTEERDTQVPATHAEVGAFLLGVWGLPFSIVEAVANHHKPHRNAHHRLGLPQIVWISSCLVRNEEPDPEYLAKIGATEQLPNFRALLENGGA